MFQENTVYAALQQITNFIIYLHYSNTEQLPFGTCCINIETHFLKMYDLRQNDDETRKHKKTKADSYTGSNHSVSTA